MKSRTSFFDRDQSGVLTEVGHSTESGKFVVLERGDGRVILFGPPITATAFYYHLDLIHASRETFRDVLGGGYYERRKAGWRVYGRSEKYGACGAAVLRQVRELLKSSDHSR